MADPKLSAGDKVQIAQQHAGRNFWVYATVIVANPDGSALVQVKHRSNRADGKTFVVAKSEIRTKADLETILSTKNRKDFNRYYRERDNRTFVNHYQTQIARLSADN